MKKFLNYFIMVCAVILSLAAIIEGGQSLYQKYHGNTPSAATPSRQEMIVYLEQISPIAEQISGTVQKAAPALDEASTHKQEALSKIKKARETFVSLKNQAAHVKAPQSVENLHQQWVDAIGMYVDAFQKTENGIAEGKQDKISDGIALLEKGSKQFNDVSQEIAHQVPEK